MIFDLLEHQDGLDLIVRGESNVLQWLVYFGDLTGIRAVLRAGGSLAAINLEQELVHAAFLGHWKICDFLLSRGADPNHAHRDTGETALHSALTEAGRPYYLWVLQVLLENGANPHARTIPGLETGAFLRDLRTCGETPLHRAAAYGDADMIDLLLRYGAQLDVTDAYGDSPLTWANRHMRPGPILERLQFGSRRKVAPRAPVRPKDRDTHDRSWGWGNGVEWNLYGEYLPESTSTVNPS